MMCETICQIPADTAQYCHRYTLFSSTIPSSHCNRYKVEYKKPELVSSYIAQKAHDEQHEHTHQHCNGSILIKRMRMRIVPLLSCGYVCQRLIPVALLLSNIICTPISCQRYQKCSYSCSTSFFSRSSTIEWNSTSNHFLNTANVLFSGHVLLTAHHSLSCPSKIEEYIFFRIRSL